MTATKLALPFTALTVSAAAAVVFGALSLGGQGGGAIQVRTAPPGASVFVNGEFRGASPVTIHRLRPEASALRIEKAGFDPLRTSLTATEGRRDKTYALVPAARGALEVTSVPTGAEVFLDGRFRGVTPLALEDLRAGTYALAVEKANHHPWTSTATVREGRTSTVSCELSDRLLEYLQNALAAAPDEIPRYMELGHYYFIVDDVENAADIYRRGLILAEDKSADLQGRHVEAAKAEDMLERKLVQAQRTRVKSEKKKLDRQIHADRKAGGHEFRAAMDEVTRQVRSRFPRSVAVALKKAKAAETRGDVEEAAEIVEQATRILPGSAALWERHAGYRAKLGDFAGLCSALARTFKLSGQDIGIRQRLAEVYLENAERFDAKAQTELGDILARELTRARQRANKNQKHSLALLEYQVCRRANDVKRAVHALKTALRSTDDDAKSKKLRTEARGWLEDVSQNSADPVARSQAEAELARF